MMHTQGVDMTHGPLSRKIWLMAIPLAPVSYTHLTLPTN